MEKKEKEGLTLLMLNILLLELGENMTNKPKLAIKRILRNKASIAKRSQPEIPVNE